MLENLFPKNRKNIENILSEAQHRPWKMPAKKWQYYQEWNKALFLHFEVDKDELRKLVPDALLIDNFNGKYYISVVVFKMQKIRPRNLPSVQFISDFWEVNVRTYIKNEEKSGVYFLNIEAEKYLSAFIAKALSGLPYEKSEMENSGNTFSNKNQKKNFSLNSDFEIDEKINQKTEFDLWITERYCLYLERNNSFYRYEIHHKEWELHPTKNLNLKLNYKFQNINLTEKQLHSSHFSPGVKIVSWNAEKLKI